MLKQLVIDLIESLPKCDCCDKNIATFKWQPLKSYDSDLYKFHIECDNCTFKFGRDANARISEGRVIEFPYSETIRKIIKELEK